MSGIRFQSGFNINAGASLSRGDAYKAKISTEEFEKVDSSGDGIISMNEFLSGGLGSIKIFGAFKSKVGDDYQQKFNNVTFNNENEVKQAKRSGLEAVFGENNADGNKIGGNFAQGLGSEKKTAKTEGKNKSVNPFERFSENSQNGSNVGLKGFSDAYNIVKNVDNPLSENNKTVAKTQKSGTANPFGAISKLASGAKKTYSTEEKLNNVFGTIFNQGYSPLHPDVTGNNLIAKKMDYVI